MLLLSPAGRSLLKLLKRHLMAEAIPRLHQIYYKPVAVSSNFSIKNLYAYWAGINIFAALQPYCTGIAAKNL